MIVLIVVLLIVFQNNGILDSSKDHYIKAEGISGMGLDGIPKEMTDEDSSKADLDIIGNPNRHKKVAADIADENGKIGSLEIAKIRVLAPVYKSDDNTAMEAMSKGIAHFSNTSIWDGNIGLSAHNINMDQSNGIFLNLHKLENGDTVVYKTELGERSYIVETIKEIDENDWSMFAFTDDNRLTLLTCISGQPTRRLAVQAKLIEN